MIALSDALGLPLVAAGDVLYHSAERMPLHDVLTAIKHHTTVAEAGSLLQPNAQRHLRTVSSAGGYSLLLIQRPSPEPVRSPISVSFV
jgi:DNA polymerase III alpha subunit